MSIYTLQIIGIVYFFLVFFNCLFLDDGVRDYFMDIFFPIKMIINFFKWVFRAPVDDMDHDNFPL